MMTAGAAAGEKIEISFQGRFNVLKLKIKIFHSWLKGGRDPLKNIYIFFWEFPQLGELKYSYKMWHKDMQDRLSWRKTFDK